jgi:GSH-dependent disulfide-bond oxidoreductase
MRVFGVTRAWTIDYASRISTGCNAMIDFYFSPTPNGLKIKLFFEETGLAHRVVPMRLSQGDQFKPEYLAISPNNKMPAIVDHDPSDGAEPLSLFESGAILLYLAEKTKRFIPTDMRHRAELTQWLFWQMAGLGPMAGQAGYFNVYASEKVPFAIERYTKEVRRLYGVLDKHLADREYIVGDYSIADIACYPWIVPHRPHGQNLEEFPNLQRWFETIGQRPATQRAYDGVEDVYAVRGESVSTAR